MKTIERLRNAKPGDIITVLGRLFHEEMYRNRAGELCPIIIAVEENSGNCITFSHAVGYDDKNDKELRHWVCDSLSYGEGDVERIYACLEPTAKQYAAICNYLVPRASEWNGGVGDEKLEAVRKEKDEQIARLRAEADYWKKEYELSGKAQAQPKEAKDAYCVEAISDYINQSPDINDLATIMGLAAVKLAYGTEAFGDKKENIVIQIGNSKEYPLQVALVKDDDPIHVQTEFEHACFMEIHGLATPKQIAFRNYCAELMGYYAKHKSLRNFSDISKKYGVSGLTKEQFHEYRFDEPEWVEAQGTDYIDKIYEQIKKRER